MTTEKKNNDTQATNTQPKVVWEFMPAGGPSPHVALRAWRLVSNSERLYVENAEEKDALGMPRWKFGSLNELPAAGRSYIAGIVFRDPSVGKETELFMPVIDENTPDITRELSGKSLAFAAKVMALAISEHAVSLRDLVAALKNRGLAVKGESPALTAVRLISELTAEKARLEGELADTKKKLTLFEKGAGMLACTIFKIQCDLALRNAMYTLKPGASLNEMASGLLQYLADSMVDVVVESVTTTVATQTPVFSA